VRRLQGPQQGQPLASRAADEDAAGAREHRRHIDLAQRLADEQGLVVRTHQNGNVPWARRSGGAACHERRAGGEQPGDVGGQVRGHQLPRPAHQQQPISRERSLAAPGHPQPQRVAGHPPVGVCRLHRAYDDVGVAQGSAAKHGLQPGDQRRVAAPVAGEGPPGQCVGRGGEVRGQVGTAEGVDRLLRVADQHQRGRAVERRPQDLPLHRVGVLELVDQHHPVALADPRPRRVPARRMDQRVAQPGEQVVVVEQPAGPLAGVHLAAYGARQPVALVGGGIADRVVRHQRGLRVTHRVPPDLQGAGVVNLRLARTLGRELAQVEVVDHLPDQVVDPLDEPGVAVDVTGGPQPGEHL